MEHWTSGPGCEAKYLPADAQANLTEIDGSITMQSSYPVESPARNAINRSYSHMQKLMLIVATCLHSINWSVTFSWGNVDVQNMLRLEGLLI